MPMAGSDNSFDLLGLGGPPEPKVIQVAPHTPQPFQVGPSEDDPAIRYPPAWKQQQLDNAMASSPSSCDGGGGNTGSGGYPVAREVQSSNPVASAATGTEGANGGTSATPLEPGVRRHLVRCEGRWRVRSAPSMSSKVIGTIANGTIVLARDEPPDDGSGGSGGVSKKPAAIRLPPNGNVDPDVISSLWVRVVRFETQEPTGVSEIKRDTASGGAMFCLRRNALGYGLYEVDVEPLEGPLVTLPENLSSELRSDAQRAAADKSEDVSLTWKLLGAAESFGRFFSHSMSATDETGGINKEIRAPVKRRPEEVFEARQREQLKKAAGNLKKATQKLVDIAKGADGSQQAQIDVTAGLPKQIIIRFARLRSSLATCATGATLIVAKPPAASPNAAAATSSSATPAASKLVPDSVTGDLERFIELCTRVERTGGWPELSNELRQEVINFAQKHVRDLEEHARVASKMGSLPVVAKDRINSTDSGGTVPVPSSPSGGVAGIDSLLGSLDKPAASPPAVAGPSIASSKPGAMSGEFVPLLAPPPPPASGVSTGQLI